MKLSTALRFLLILLVASLSLSYTSLLDPACLVSNSHSNLDACSQAASDPVAHSVAHLNHIDPLLVEQSPVELHPALKSEPLPRSGALLFEPRVIAPLDQPPRWS